MARTLASNPPTFSGIQNAGSDLDNSARSTALGYEDAALAANATVMSANELTSIETICNALRGRGQRHIISSLLSAYDRPQAGIIPQNEEWALTVAGATRV